VTKPLAEPGEVIDLNRCTTTPDANQISVLVQSQNVKIVRLSVSAGSTIPTYEAAGEIILHCLEGRISVIARGEFQELSGGQLLYLALNEAFSIQAVEHAVVLATVIAPKQGANVRLIGER
jgi:quercetin dioxygenase-like cupin family protein